jgi:tetratricopeptide (TPR) repeat protein
MKRALLLMLVAAGTAQAAPKFGDYVKAARAIEEWRIEDAHTLIAELARAAPDDPEVQYLEANLAFLEGDYDHALDLLDHLDDPRVKELVGSLKPLVTATRAATAGFAHRTLAGGHFEIFYAPNSKDELLVDLAGEALEAAYDTIGEDLGYKPPGKVRVEILPRTTDLARVSTLTEKEIETSGTIALCKYNKLMVVSPRATLFGYPWMDTMAHEYTHFVITRATTDKVPIWLHEGLAKFEESRWRGAPGADGMGRTHEHLLAIALRKNKLITFEQMHPSMALLPSQEAAATAFAEVWTIVQYLQEKIGYAGIRSALQKIKEGKSERRAIAEAVGGPAGTWENVEAAWKQHLRDLNLKPDPSVAGHTSHLKFDKNDKDKDKDNVGLEQIPEEKARKLARLGGLLRARGKLLAASIEYEKARAALPDDAFIGSRLARTYLELDEAQKAIDVATPLAKDVEDAGPQATLGAAYLKLGDVKKAEKYLLAAVRVSPFDPAVRCGLADAYAQDGDEARAARERTACGQLRKH